MAQNLTPEDSAMVPSYVFAGVGGYYASKQGGLAGVFRCAANGTDWKHALSEIEAFYRLPAPARSKSRLRWHRRWRLSKH
jgi:hypothetical protein